MARWNVYFSDEGWRDFVSMAVIDREAVLDVLRAWQQNDPPTANAYDHGLTIRYREPLATGHWLVYALDTVIHPPSIDIYRIDSPGAS